MSAPGQPRILSVAGLRLPLRETIVVLVTTFALLIDYYHPLALLNMPVGPAASTGLERFALFGIVPLATLLLLGERPSAYGLRLGEWRIGLAVGVGLALLVTPVVVISAGLPDFQLYYATQETSLPAILGRVVDVGAAEFLFRGFLMWTLIRLAGPMGVVLATSPSSSRTWASPSWRRSRPSSAASASAGSPGARSPSCTARCCTPTSSTSWSSPLAPESGAPRLSFGVEPVNGLVPLL